MRKEEQPFSHGMLPEDKIGKLKKVVGYFRRDIQKGNRNTEVYDERLVQIDNSLFMNRLAFWTNVATRYNGFWCGQSSYTIFYEDVFFSFLSREHVSDLGFKVDKSPELDVAAITIKPHVSTAHPLDLDCYCLHDLEEAIKNYKRLTEWAKGHSQPILHRKGKKEKERMFISYFENYGGETYTLKDSLLK